MNRASAENTLRHLGQGVYRHNRGISRVLLAASVVCIFVFFWFATKPNVSPSTFRLIIALGICLFLEAGVVRFLVGKIGLMWSSAIALGIILGLFVPF